MEFAPSPQQTFPSSQQTDELQQNSFAPQFAFVVQPAKARAWKGEPIVARVPAASPAMMRRKTCRRGSGLANKRAISSNL
jgi:hypothetical protein